MKRGPWDPPEDTETRTFSERVRIALAKWLVKDLRVWVWVMNPCRYGMHQRGRLLESKRTGIHPVDQPDWEIMREVYECRLCHAVIYGGGFIYEDEAAKYALKHGRVMK